MKHVITIQVKQNVLDKNSSNIYWLYIVIKKLVRKGVNMYCKKPKCKWLERTSLMEKYKSLKKNKTWILTTLLVGRLYVIGWDVRWN
jgi:hypothetical protein